MPIEGSQGPLHDAAVRAFPLAGAQRTHAPRRAEAAPGTAAAAPGPAPASLWEALSRDERAFFLDPAANGPLTYGQAAPGTGASAAPAPAPLGQRLDLRG